LADYLKIPEVARRLDVSEPTVRRMVKGGKLPSVFIGGAYRVSEADLEEFLENARVTPGKAPAPSLLEPSLLNGLEEERRAEWDAAVRSARQLRERGRARMEELIAAWRDKQDRHTLHAMGQLLQEAYDAETGLAHYLEEESTGRVRLDRVPITEWEEVRKASRFYGALVEMVQGAGLRVRTEGKAHEVAA
jgi:excisionase family DNA binding protein